MQDMLPSTPRTKAYPQFMKRGRDKQVKKFQDYS